MVIALARARLPLCCSATRPPTEIAALYERNADARAAGLRALGVPARRAINSNASRPRRRR